MAEGFPESWRADVILSDGGLAHVRPIQPADADALQKFHRAQSEQSRYFRFFAPLERLSDRDLERFTNVDNVDRFALVATSGETIIGVARYDRIDEESAEVAFNISDRHQRRGIASVLLEHLADAARSNGITRFRAEVLPTNTSMLRVFAEAGFDVAERYDDGVVQVDFDLGPTSRSLAVMQRRERRSEARSIRSILEPRSIAVIGAGRDPSSIGHRILRDIIHGGFCGRVVPVNPRAGTVEGLTAIGSLRDAHREAGESAADIVVIAVPSAAVADAVKDAARAGAHAVIVVAEGFTDADPQGAISRDELVALVRTHGMRLVGPNSLGVLNSDPEVALNATLCAQPPMRGPLGLFTHSGAIGAAMLTSVEHRALGVSTFLSSGRRADVSVNDMLQFWDSDDRTEVAAMYLESIGNPRRFLRIAKRVSRHTPIVVVRTAAPGTEAERAATSELLRHAGVLEATDPEQLLDVAEMLVKQPLPTGSRVAVIANSESLGRICVTAAQAAGLTPAHVDTTHLSCDATTFEAAIRAAQSADGVDAVLVAYVPPLGTVPEGLVDAIATASNGSVATVVALLGAGPLAAHAGGTRMVQFPSIERAVTALRASITYGRWRSTDPGTTTELVDVDVTRARAIVDDALRDGVDQVRLGRSRTSELLACYGISVTPSIQVRDAESAVAAADSLGWPIALKTADTRLRHRLDLGAVRLDVDTSDALRRDFADMMSDGRILDSREGYIVQPMVPEGIACMVRLDVDPSVGPVVSFGLSGDPSELLGDIARGVAPLTDVDIRELVASIKAAPLLFGYRGLPKMDIGGLERLILAVSQLAEDVTDIARVELNPVLVGTATVSVLSAEIAVAEMEQGEGLRRMLTQ